MNVYTNRERDREEQKDVFGREEGRELEDASRGVLPHLLEQRLRHLQSEEGTYLELINFCITQL